MISYPLDIRWKQRFDNFTRVKKIFESFPGTDLVKCNEVEIAGWIHIFDLIFELSWKTLRDYMVFEGEGERMDFPREVIMLGANRGILPDGYVWLDMLADRNSSTHEYDEKNTREALDRIQKIYAPEILSLYTLLQKKYEGSA